MKKIELLSIKQCIKNGAYSVTLHSYGTSSMGYLVNYRLTIKDPVHVSAFNRSKYFICFSSKAWYVVKYEGAFYNHHFLSKYAVYDEEIESVFLGSRERLSELLR